MDSITNDLFTIPTSLLKCTTNETKREYLTLDDTVKALKIKKEEMISLISLGSLRPCFYWEGYLKYSEEMSLEKYNDMFNKYDAFKNNTYERMADSRLRVLAHGYNFFKGYITPHTAQPYLASLLVDDPCLFSLDEVNVIENYTTQGKVVYVDTDSNNDKHITLTVDQNYYFDSKLRYSIHPKSPSKEFSFSKCVFLKAQVEFQKSKRKNDEKIIKKDVFNMVVPLVAKYLFSVDPTIKLPEEILNGRKMETEEKTIKALVKEYLENDKDLKVLLSNFDDNWQKIMNENIGNKKRIAQIKDAILAEKGIANI
ncbi:hypothetical protein AYK86_04695 [Acinetobacter venetianus]|uniref:hypothetical protein n=2 Tax=Moraxellaceae TaxID=468 RepID=UPI000775AA84|nr:hypothetical protein [Acinetobacter venetianus]KXO85502.1 hypothetical protein AYK86_04695 [Acinetobacter venetianus]